MRARVASFAAVSILVFAACGGGSDTTTEGGPAQGNAGSTSGGGAQGGKGGAGGAQAGKGGAGGAQAGKGGASAGTSGAAGKAGASGAAAGGGGSSGSSGTGGKGGASGVGGASSGSGGAAGAGGCACKPTEQCVGGACIPKLSCVDGDGCDSDMRCDPAMKVCVPWTTQAPALDLSCIHLPEAGVLTPAVGCEFSVAPQGDPFPSHVDVQGTPIVLPFDAGKDIVAPVIAAAFTATVPGGYTEELGVVRVLDGGTCALQANLGGTDLDGDGAVDWIVSSASVAGADLDSDGAPEIVAYGGDGALLAFTRKAGAWKLLWKSPKEAMYACDTTNHRCPVGWGGPAIYDLDDDGKPEIVREGFVYSASGAKLSGLPNGYASFSSGLFGVVANIDGDPAPELLNGARAWEWKGGAWVDDAGYQSALGPGHVAVADFGAFGSGLPSSAPEIVVGREGTLTIHDRTGAAIYGPITIPGGGTGGPPTVADFDGDGLPEIAIASKAYYTLFDIDCVTPRPGGVCPKKTCDFGACPAGIAWSRATQDISSSVTGSSVFDFEGDGIAEVVYGDECFTRVYSGTSGDVLFSQYRSSCTWYENPVIADTDGNYRADLVVPSNKACSSGGAGVACNMLNADGVDPQFNGLRCKSAKDCGSGTCDAGLCRCTASAQCCAKKDDAACLEEGFKCAPPNAGTAGTGNTCRAAHPHGVSGIRVYRDANDQWVRARPIWNQHAYAITHVTDTGAVPKTSDWKPNWLEPGLNNFRQNVPGKQNPTAVPDLTVHGATGFTCTSKGHATLQTEVCNRGADVVGAGVSVAFQLGSTTICGAVTKAPILPGACESLSCAWSSTPTAPSSVVDIIVRADEGGKVTECFDANNETVIPAVVCP